MQASPARWLRGPAWDTALLAFCWVPFYLYFVFGLGIGRHVFGGAGLGGKEGRAALGTAILVVLALTWVHRHYTFFLVYGDRDTFSRRSQQFVLAPVILLAVVVMARWGRDFSLVSSGPLRVTPWLVLLFVSGTWNVWHTVQQRYGIFRIYAGKSRAGLEQPAHGRRDRAMIWSAVILLAVIMLTLRLESLGGHPSARRVMQVVQPVVAKQAALAILGAIAAVAVVVIAWWLRHELRAPLATAERVPRWSFLGSTFLLLGVFVLHGPVLGYLCFATAHAVEYVAFVHHFGEGKFKKRPDDRGAAARLLRNPLPLAPLLVFALGATYLALQGYKRTEVYLTYYFTTSMLHFLFDGWIWKVRRPEVARPLGVSAAG